MIADLATTLTDFALAAECVVLACLVRWPGPSGRWLRIFFVSIGAAAALGGAVHGFFPDEGSPMGELLWTATLLAIGGTALAAWAIGAHLRFEAMAARLIVRAAAVQLAVYGLIVLLVSRDFVVAIVDYVPATLFLLVVLVLEHRRRRDPKLLVGAAGLALVLAGSAVQQGPLATRNVLYHLIEAVALLLMLAPGRGGTHVECMSLD
jgi:hypothetical protein